MPDLETTLALRTRNRTIAELPPQMSSHRMLVNGAAGQTDDGYTTLTISDDAAQLLAEILIRYNSASDAPAVRFDTDHDVAFWDGIACDLLVAAQITPPRGSTTMAHSLGKTADLGRRETGR